MKREELLELIFKEMVDYTAGNTTLMPSIKRIEKAIDSYVAEVMRDALHIQPVERMNKELKKRKLQVTSPYSRDNDGSETPEQY